jgi:hypothetical protein
MAAPASDRLRRWAAALGCSRTSSTLHSCGPCPPCIRPNSGAAEGFSGAGEGINPPPPLEGHAPSWPFCHITRPRQSASLQGIHPVLAPDFVGTKPALSLLMLFTCAVRSTLPSATGIRKTMQLAAGGNGHASRTFLPLERGARGICGGGRSFFPIWAASSFS